MIASDDALLRLALTPGLGARGYAALQETLLEAGIELDAFLHLPRSQQRNIWHETEKKFAQNSRITRKILPHLEDIPSGASVKDYKRRLQSIGCQWIGSDHSAFPRRLISGIAPPPPVLFWMGDLSLLDRSPTAGIIGTKAPSRAGLRVARALGRALAESGWLIVSGMAKGIDQAGHRGALEAGGATVAFLPQGILTMKWPPALREFSGMENFLIVSTWQPDAEWAGSLAVRRDVQIADASDGVIAVEMSARGGGTKYTVEFARERQRPVWTVRHPTVPKQAIGNTWLIRTGAIPIDINEKYEIDGRSFKSLVSQLKKELARGKKRRQVMQLEMF